MNRTMYDACSQQQQIQQSVSPLSYQLDPVKFNHCQKCRPELGIVGGTAVSHVSGNLVDLENDLRGQNRPLTHCSAYKYMPTHEQGWVQGKEYIKPVCHPRVSTRTRDLAPCNLTAYPGVPPEPEMDLFDCPSPEGDWPKRSRAEGRQRRRGDA